MPAKVYEKVIVFGPTGKVGSVVATTAHKYGSEVYLAMRDTKKAIPDLTPAEESEGKYHRVQADLTKPDTIKAALKKADGVKAAFVYLAWHAEDHQKAAFQALKDGGIELVVFLSSFTVPDKQKQIDKIDDSDDLIQRVHTQTEVALASVFSEKEYVALRPGFFAPNVLASKLGIIAGSVRIARPDVTFDYITPDDIGNVGGNILAKGQRDGQNIVYLFGPDMISQREAFLKIGKAIGKDITVSEATEEQAIEDGVASTGYPREVVALQVKHIVERKQGEDNVSKKQYETGKANVEKYAARPGMRLEDWADKNKDLIASEIKDVATEMPESAPEPEEPEEEEEAAGEEGEEGEKKEGEEKEEGKGKEDGDKKKE